MLQSAVAIILVLGLLVFFHELGHFLAARALRMGVKVFSLGFGPPLARFKRGRTEYRISAVPLGGYVSLVGESKNAEIPPEFTDRENFSLRPPWQRMLVVAAGPIFNFVLAWLILWGILWVNGATELLTQVGAVEKNGPAQQAGIRPGDEITAINDRKVEYWTEMVQAIRENGTKPLTIAYQRDGQITRTTVKPKIITGRNLFGEEIQKPVVGILSGDKYKTIELGFFESAYEGASGTAAMISLTWQGIIKIVEGIIPLENIGGPILIAQEVSKRTSEGLASLLLLTALISVNLGILNLLPIPVLDGGHLLFYGIETIARRPLSEKVQTVTTYIGLSLLLALMALATFNDVFRITQNATQQNPAAVDSEYLNSTQFETGEADAPAQDSRNNAEP